MASTFTTNTGIEKIGDGQQSGLWGQTTNLNFDIVDRALNGVFVANLTGSTFTLTTSQGALSDGQAASVVFAGSLSGPTTVTVAPDTAQKTYFFKNNSNQSVVVTQGSGASITIPPSGSALALCNGGGAGAAVINLFPTAELSELFQGTAGRLVDSAGVYTASAPVALTDGATITPDFQAGRTFSVTLGGNRTLANPTNQVAGQTGVVIVKQDSTGSRTLSYGTNWKFSLAVPTLTTDANGVDVIGYYVESPGTILCSFTRDFQ